MKLTLILCSIIVVFAGAVLSQVRPPYTTFSYKSAWNFENHEEYPYDTIDQMCYDDSISRWCDSITDPYPIQTYINWLGLEFGNVFYSEEGCFIWTYKPFWGEDGQPHIQQHDWIVCPLDF